jgi:putative membrane protein
MKKISLAPLFIGAIMFSACNGNTSNSATTDSTTTTSTMSGDTAHAMNNNTTATTDTMSNKTNTGNTTGEITDDIRNFAQKAATGGMMEVELGNIAQKNSSTQQIKDFGKMMVDDHSKANSQLKDLASVKNINLPTLVTSDQQKDIDKLSKKTGAEFDKAYVSMMIDDHKKDIKEFKDAQEKAKDADVKNFISNTLPVLQKHLDAIQAIDKKM